MTTILTIAVHGTFAGIAYQDNDANICPIEWWHKAHFFMQTYRNKFEQKYPEGTVIIRDFQWSGANSDKERRQEAINLKKSLDELESEINPDRVIILAHSHGGNVVQYMMDEHDSDLEVDIYTFGRPLSLIHI